MTYGAFKLSLTDDTFTKKTNFDKTNVNIKTRYLWFKYEN